MQPLGAGLGEAPGLAGGVVAEHGYPFHVALIKAHALAVLEVDGGKEDHFVFLPLRAPVEKIGDQLQAHGLAFLRVELGPGQVVAADGGYGFTAVIDAGENVSRVGR